MSAVFFSLFALLAGLTIHVGETVDDMMLVIVDASGEIVGQVAAPAPGDYVFDDLADGSYTVRALVMDRVVVSIREVVVPLTESIEISVTAESVGEAEEQQETGARRNQNIQVNLIDNQALNEALGRQGAQVNPITEFSAVRGNYAVELGGIGRDPQINRGDRRGAYHGEIYETHNNNVLNARTFFGSSAEFVGKTVFHRRLRRPRCSPSLKASLASSAAAPALTLGCAPRCRLVWAMGNGASGGGSGHRV